MREVKDLSAGDVVDFASTGLSWASWEALPLTARISDQLVEILLAAHEIRAELDGEEGVALRSIVPDIESVLQRVEEVLQRLVS